MRPMEGVYKETWRHLKQAAKQQKRTYDTRVQEDSLNVGDLCWVANKYRKKDVLNSKEKAASQRCPPLPQNKLGQPES